MLSLFAKLVDVEYPGSAGEILTVSTSPVIFQLKVTERSVAAVIKDLLKPNELITADWYTTTSLSIVKEPFSTNGPATSSI